MGSTFASIPREIYTTDNFYNQAQSSFVSTVTSQTNERLSPIPIVDLLETNYDDGQYVYYRTDKNWTADGAYLAYSAFCEARGFDVVPIMSFSKNTMNGFLGSFYNVVAFRLPKGESIIFPGSHCPNCKHELQFWELIPIISFILQKGKCF